MGGYVNYPSGIKKNIQVEKVTNHKNLGMNLESDINSTN